MKTTGSVNTGRTESRQIFTNNSKQLRDNLTLNSCRITKRHTRADVEELMVSECSHSSFKNVPMFVSRRLSVDCLETLFKMSVSVTLMFE